VALRFEDVSFAFPGRPVFDGFSLEIASPGVTALLGPSGCGKTTLLRLAAGLSALDGGRIVLDGEPLRVSYVFQEPRLLPWRTAADNVAIPLRRIYGAAGARRRAAAYLEYVGLADRAAAYPDELSGGQLQRVSLARAFAFPAPAVLLDEPFQALDLPLRIQLMELTLRLLAESPRLALAVTHDPREAIFLADRAIVIAGTPAAVVCDFAVELSRADRAYSSPAGAGLEARLFAALTV
jgi:NitT/TauT family transport system ATP-binding protein